MDVLAVGRAMNPVMTPRTIAGASISSPGNRVAMSVRPTLVFSLVSAMTFAFPVRSGRKLAHSLISGCAYREGRLDIAHNHDPLQRAWVDVPGLDKPFKPLPQTVVVAVGIEQHDGLVVHAEVAGRPCLEELLECADATG